MAPSQDDQAALLKQQENQLAALKQQRQKARASITRIQRGIADKPSTNYIELECRLEILNSYIKQLVACQSEIAKLDPADTKGDDIEEFCIQAKTIVVTALKALKGPSEAQDNSMNNSTINHQVVCNNHLPAIKLPKFGGKYEEYKNFISNFKKLVHNDSSLNKTEKFNHLLSCLTDEALSTIKRFQLTEENYDSALQRLEDRYDNKYRVFKNLIASLFDLPLLKHPNASGLRKIVDTVSAVIDSLSTLGSDKEILHSIIIHMVMTKVDSVSKEKWDERSDYKTLPTWTSCADVLTLRCQVLEDSAGSRNLQQIDKSKPQNKTNRNSTFVANKVNPAKCTHCAAIDHYISVCPSFQELSFKERFSFVKKNSMCLNCLRKGHSVSKCNSSKCKTCGKKHHTLLHNSDALTSTEIQLTDEKPCCSTSISHKLCTSDHQTLHAMYAEEQIILATAIIYIKDKFGIRQPARALLDSGSQLNFMSESMAHTLCLKRKAEITQVGGIGQASVKINHKLDAVITSRTTEFTRLLEFLIIRNISSYQPAHTLCIKDLNIPPNLPLADPAFNEPKAIDVLLGADTFFELLSVGQIRLGTNQPILQKTLLGWIVSGKAGQSTKESVYSALVANAVETEDLSSIDATLKRFWELEEIPSVKLLTDEQRLCEEHFQENIRQLPNGRFEVALPFKIDPAQLGSSYDMAKRRQLALERRLAKDPELHGMYKNFMNEYIDLGHMSELLNYNPQRPHCFIPHHCVMRPDSTTTKLRVVFDASSRTSSQLALNEALMVGPTIQPDLFTILIQFRLHRYAITADITKMYRQILVAEADRKFQLILWRESTDKPLKIFQLNTVTYGTASAPFLAVRCLNEIASKFKDAYPIGAETIRNNFYVDDMLASADSLEELNQIKAEVVSILEGGGFSLAKWHSNHESFNTSEIDKKLDLNEQEEAKALGIYWKVSDDTFRFKITDNFSQLKATKRNILSLSAKLFDPLGLLGPIVVRAKIILQELWLNKIDWDESVPLHIETAWNQFKICLQNLHKVSLPRFIQTSTKAKCQIHGFSDASMRAYGCCIYVRSNINGRVSSNLLTAKSKVAPLKTKSVPRLELCAALLLVNLWEKIQSILNLDIERVVFWCDSQIILHWLRVHPSTLSTFVANRIAKIQECNSHVEWRHVPTKLNPADIISRGCDTDELIDSMWQKGPEFITQEEEFWPVNKTVPPTDLEQKHQPHSLHVVSKSAENWVLLNMERHSSSNKMIRIMAYVLRFVSCTRKKRRFSSLILLAVEMECSLYKIIEMIQSLEFETEITMLKQSRSLKTSIQTLNPYLHQFERDNMQFTLLRVGGRLFNAPVPYFSRFPALLTKNSHFIKAYFRTLHIENFHAGAKLMVELLRQKIWVVNAREVARQTVRSCVRCFKFKPRFLQQIMGNLPSERFAGVRPFFTCGVDFCGPIKTSYGVRGQKSYNSFVAVFVCFSSKAVHLEAVSDLSTDSFLLSLRRFIARRNYPSVIWCDNAKNFQGAANALRANILSDISLVKVNEYAAKHGTQFKFIPPRAPHFGGLWEAAVKSAKHLLLRSMTSTTLNIEELNTFLVDIEGILNSRPISTISDDPSDGEPLTPAHFLTGSAFKPTLPEDPIETKGCSLKRYRQLCSMRDHFWRTWQTQYIHTLQQRAKWLNPSSNVAVGTVVLIHDDNAPPQNWTLGRIIQVCAGSDNKVRVAKVRTTSGISKRPIHKLAPLPLPEDSLQTS